MAKEKRTPSAEELQAKRDRHAANMRAYRAKNPEKFKELDKRLAAAFPEPWTGD